MIFNNKINNIFVLNPFIFNSTFHKKQLNNNILAYSLQNNDIQPPKVLKINDGKHEGVFAKFVIAGVSTFIYELIAGHFFEFIKIAKQTQSGSYLQLTKNIIGKKGLIGVLDGYFPWGSIQALGKGASFGLGHALARNQLMKYTGDDGIISDGVAEVIAGGIGGGFQGFVLSPLLLLKTRVMTDPIFRENMTLAQTTIQSTKIGLKVIKNEGVLALMKGSVVFAGKRVADWSTRFLFSVIAEDLLFRKGDSQKKLKVHEQLSAALIGGFFSAVVTIPIDVMVAQIQQASKAGQKVGVIETFKDEFKQGGMQRVAGFAMRGFWARMLHVALTTALLKTVASQIYEKYMDMKKKNY